MLFILREIIAKSWQRYIPTFIACSIATIFIFLQLTAKPFLDASLQVSSAKTAGISALTAVQSQVERDSALAKILQHPEVKQAEISTTLGLQAVSGAKAINAVAVSQTKTKLSSVVINAGKIPSKANEILISKAAAKELNAQIGDQISLISEQSTGTKISEVMISGILQYSPFTSEPRIFEIISPNIAAINPEAAENQILSNDNCIEIYTSETSPTKDIALEISAQINGTLITNQEIYAQEYSNQQEVADYLNSSIHWLFSLPIVLCLMTIYTNLVKISNQRQHASALLRAMGYSNTKLMQLIAGELFCVTLLSTAIGILISRAVSVYLASFLASQPIGAFLSAEISPVNLPDYFLTILFLLLLSSVVFIIAFCKIKLSEQNTISNLTHSRSEQFEELNQTAAQNKNKRAMSWQVQKLGHEFFGIKLILVTIVFTIVIYYVAVIPQNLLSAAGISAELDNIRSITRIALLLLIGVLSFLLLRKIFRFILFFFTKWILRAPRIFNKFNFLHPENIDFPAILLLGSIAAITTLVLTSQITNLIYRDINNQEVLYQATAERSENSADASLSADDQKIITTLQAHSNIEAVTVLNSFLAQIYQNETLMIDSIPFAIVDENLKKFIKTDQKHVFSLPKPHTLVLPDDYNWLDTKKNTATRLALPWGKEKILDQKFQIIFADTPWPLISAQDAKMIASEILASPSTQNLDPNTAQYNTAEVQKQPSYFLIRFTPKGQATLAKTYASLISAQSELPNLRFSLAASPTPIFIQNSFSIWLTIVLLVFLLIVSLVNLASAYFTTFTNSKNRLRLALTLGIPPHKFIQTIIFSALGTTLLSIAVGIIVGIFSSIFLVQEFIWFLPKNYYSVIPWQLFGIIIVISTSLVGLILQIRILRKQPL